MKVAGFVDRSATAALQILQGIDRKGFIERLRKLSVAIAFDASAASCSEGLVCIEITVDLLARFYPGICFIPLDQYACTIEVVDRLKKVAHSIHPEIDTEVRASKVCACLVVGERAPDSAAPTFFLGSSGWNAKCDRSNPLSCLDSGNPFGAGVSACLGVANVFRTVFGAELADAPCDESLALDVLHFRAGPSPSGPALPATDIGHTHLVGLGAIGRAAAWSLARTAGVSGFLHGIDHERIDHSNLQRYVGTTRRDLEKSRMKTASVAKMFEASEISFVEHAMTWGNFLRETGDFKLNRVAVALDTANGRIDVQASLPQRILNAWTQPGDLGISRHDFISGPCLACLYLPDKPVPSFSELVAGALNLPEREIRDLLHRSFVVDHVFLERVAKANNIHVKHLEPFVQKPLDSFYSKAVCGTTLFGRAKGGDRGQMAVPMAFQSALAGVLLAAEIVADCSSVRAGAIPPLTKINLLRPLKSHFNEPAVKHASGRCLCQDSVYIKAYEHKFS